jgi:hypothetical protein
MGRLHDRMAEDLRLRKFSPATQRNYLFYARRFAAFFMRSPEELGEAEVRRFLLHQIEVKHLSYAAYRQIYAALKCSSGPRPRSGQAPRLRSPGLPPPPAPCSRGRCVPLPVPSTASCENSAAWIPEPARRPTLLCLPRGDRSIEQLIPDRSSD